MAPVDEEAPSAMRSGAVLRQVVRISQGTQVVRLRFSNEYGSEPLVLEEVFVALAGAGGAIQVSSDRPVSFGGLARVSLPPGAVAVSDPLAFPAGPRADLGVTLRLGSVPARVAGHPGSRATSYLDAGARASSERLDGASAMVHWYFLTGIETEAPASAGAVVCLGDSFTDGHGSGTDKNNRWTDALSERLLSDPGTADISVLNLGIGGNRLLHPGLGPSGLSRLPRDVFGQAGARWVVLQLGVNDLGSRIKAREKGQPFASADDIISGYRQAVEACHAHGIRVAMVTLSPFVAATWYCSPDVERDRLAINDWIRRSSPGDVVVDFDAALRDPADPTRLRPSYDSGDHLHPSVEGYRLMAALIPGDFFAARAPAPQASKVTPTTLPAGASLVGADPLAAFSLRAASSTATLGTVAVDGPGFTRALSIATLQDAGPAEAVELRSSNHVAVRKGDVAMLRFLARGTATTDESGTARVLVVVRGTGEASRSSFEGDFSVGREWQEVLVPFAFAADYPEGGAAILLRFGFKRQTLELGGLDVLNYGQTQALADLPRTSASYAGREKDAPWRAAALARIARLRQTDFEVRVTDASGRAVSGAQVRATETRSAFEWGSALQMARLVKDSPDNLRYREKVLELFNSASTENDLKWPVWLGEWEGAYSQEQTLAGLRWLKAHGLDVRGHVLVWPGRKNLPRPVQERLGTARQPEIPGIIEAHIREMARATRGLVTEWDVLNEPYTNHDLMDAFGPGIMVTWFKTAREAMPATRLFFNDFSNHDATTDADHVAHYEKTARFLLDQGAPVTGLGLQAHVEGRPNAPEHILDVLDRYERDFHLPVRITEFDVKTYDEGLQADFTRDFLILCYSHPSVIGVQFWGFWEGAHWRPAAAMFRQDWSEKPSAKVYRDLVLGQWRTRTAGATGTDGACHLRGFQGAYAVDVSYQGRTVERTLAVPAGAQPVVLEVPLP